MVTSCRNVCAAAIVVLDAMAVETCASDLLGFDDDTTLPEAKSKPHSSFAVASLAYDETEEQLKAKLAFW